MKPSKIYLRRLRDNDFVDRFEGGQIINWKPLEPYKIHEIFVMGRGIGKTYKIGEGASIYKVGQETSTNLK